MMTKRLSASLMLLTATIIWGSAFVSQRIAMDFMPPFSFQASRCFLAFLVMLPIVAIGDRVTKRKESYLRGWLDGTLWKGGILCGIPLFLACNLQQLALVDTDAGKSGFLTAMYIVFVPLMGLARKQKLSPLMPFSILLAVGGLYLLCCKGVTSLQISDLLLLGCAVMFALQINIVDRFVGRVDPLRLNALQILICTVLSAAVMIFRESPQWEGTLQCIPQLLHVGILSMGVSYGLQILAQKDLPQAPASLIMSLEAVFAALFGWCIAGEKMDSWELLGSGLLFLAVILSQFTIKKKTEPK